MGFLNKQELSDRQKLQRLEEIFAGLGTSAAEGQDMATAAEKSRLRRFGRVARSEVSSSTSPRRITSVGRISLGHS